MNRILLSRSLQLSRQIPLIAPNLRLSSSSSSSSDPPPNPQPEPTFLSDPPPKPDPPVPGISNSKFKRRIKLYLKGGDKLALPSIIEAVFARRASRDNEETDDELIDELRMKPLDDVKDWQFESDFEEMHDTAEEFNNLYNARDYMQKKMMKDEFINMDDKKRHDMIKEAMKGGFLKDTRECEEILEDMLSWDKLLPDEMKKVETKFNLLGDMCERGEREPEKAYELFKEFEDQVVLECAELMEAEQPEIAQKDKDTESDDPPGEGPILRWESQVVFAPGG